MERDEAITLLLAGPEGIARWNACRAESDFRCPNLNSANFSNADLTNVDLCDAALSGAVFINANLCNAKMDEADLRHAILASANLRAASLRHVNARMAIVPNADMQSAILSGSVLRGACLSGTECSHADFRNSDLAKANFAGANLAAAQLQGANLVETNLTEADLTRANLVNANLTWTKLMKTALNGALVANTTVNTDLSGAQGLDTLRFTGAPSPISLYALITLNRACPRFLRGVVQDDELAHAIQLHLDNRDQYYSCFISYSHMDKGFARQLHDALKGQGVKCWLDEHELKPGDKIYSRVDRAIDTRDKVLLCASENSLKSWWVDNEINSAITKEQKFWKDLGVEFLTLIPLNLDGYLFSNDWRNGWKDQILARLAADFTGWENDDDKFQNALQKVLVALKIA